MDTKLTGLQSAYRFPKRDRRPIYEWARQHVVLPQSYAVSGGFDVRTSPWLIAIFDALQHGGIRQVHFRKGIQVGGTLIADVLVPWIIVNDPGPISMTMHVDDMMERHAKMRLNPVLETCKPVAALLPKPGPMRTTTEIHFGGFSLILNAANLSDQQSQSIKWKINDEIWHPKWQSVYADAIGRVSAYEAVGTSKVLNISQAGYEGDVEDRSYRGGDQCVWSVECPSCRKVHPVSFAIRESETEGAKITGGVVWNEKAKGEDDLWDVGRAVESTRFRCPHCAHESPDTDATREAWKRSGRYVAQSPSASPSRKSFHVESIVSRPMKLLTEEWLNARNELTRNGNEEPTIKFRQKREAKPWRVEKSAVNLITIKSGYRVEDYADGEPTADEAMRVMSVDRQQTHWWVLVGAWSREPKFTLLYFGRIDTIDSVRAIQQQYRVPDGCVCEDRRYQPSETDKDCARFGWRGMMGVPRKTWVMRNEATGQMDVYPYSEPRWSSVGGGVSVPFYEASMAHAKDLLFNAVNGKGFRWDMPENLTPLYLEQLKSEVKENVGGKWVYREVKQNFNHAIDVSAMAIIIAIIADIVRFKLDAEK